MLKKPTISMLLLGGTIAMAPPKDQKLAGVVPSVSAQDLSGAIAGLEDVALVYPETVKMVPSANLTIEDVLSLKAKLEESSFKQGNIDGVVIVQGTDTLEEMAFMLDLILDVSFPVIITGAMRSANMASADGPGNILSAVIAASDRRLSTTGVLVLMNDDIHAARFVQKCHTRDLGAFKSLNGGKVGQVCEGEVRLAAQVEKGMIFKVDGEVPFPKVALIKATMGDTGDFLDYVFEHNYQGLVVEAFGAGHLPESWLDRLEALTKKMPVMLCSRTLEGPVFQSTYGYQGAEIDLINRGLIAAGILDGAKARLYMQACLMSGEKVRTPDY